MFDPKEQKQFQTNTTVIPNRTPSKLAKMRDAIPSEDRIRERAYELYESRGREPGQDQQDWIQAEQQILKAKQ